MLKVLRPISIITNYVCIIGSISLFFYKVLVYFNFDFHSNANLLLKLIGLVVVSSFPFVFNKLIQ